MKNTEKVLYYCERKWQTRDADITIFDPETIIDKADFTQLSRPEGIDYVIINGNTAIAHGENVSEREGRFISFCK